MLRFFNRCSAFAQAVMKSFDVRRFSVVWGFVSVPVALRLLKPPQITFYDKCLVFEYQAAHY